MRLIFIILYGRLKLFHMDKISSHKKMGMIAYEQTKVIGIKNTDTGDTGEL